MPATGKVPTITVIAGSFAMMAAAIVYPCAKAVLWSAYERYVQHETNYDLQKQLAQNAAALGQPVKCWLGRELALYLFENGSVLIQPQSPLEQKGAQALVAGHCEAYTL